MKKIFLFLSVAILFATCKNDDNIVFPSQATITGADANVCPATTVILTAAAKDADSYQWKKDGVVINGETAATLTVTESGAYTAAGVNSAGAGTFSAVKNVTINTCITAAEQATITGDAANTCPEVTVVLTATANGATSYEWKKDGTVINGETAATLTVTESGAYTAAGVNSAGTGTFSAVKNVTINACSSVFIDDLVGDWDAVGFYITASTGDVANNDHTISIEKINATTIKIHNFLEDGYDDVVTATVDNTARTITIAYQEITPTWLTGYNTYLAALVSTTFCDNENQSIGTVNVAGTGQNLSVTFSGMYAQTIDGVQYPVTSLWLATQSGVCAGGFGYNAGTVWTKQSASGTTPQVKKSSLPKRPRNLERKLINNISVVK
ncbi:MAG: hypothetical protein LBP63_05925 [Prevotellaceae bacterium]|jgi:hypothetical protein|nr:hypothetical protein [Prevotellaceae bacterium]